MSDDAWRGAAASYDAVAGAYEDRFADELDRKPADRRLLDGLAGATQDPVLDLGCGPGQIGAHLRSRGRRVVGVDLSTEMARRARRRLDAAVTGDLRRLPFASSSVGAAVAFYSLIHLPRHELTVALAECRRVLRPGGRLVVSAHEGVGEVVVEELLGSRVSLAASFFTLDDLTHGCEQAGLEVVRADARPPYPDEGSTVRLYVEAARPASD